MFEHHGDAGLAATDGESSWACAHPLATELDGTRPGVGLATRLDDLTAADVDDAALVEMVAGWERVVSWATAAQAAVIAEMARRRRWSPDEEFLPSEIGARLATTSRAAAHKVDLAIRLDHSPALADALASGVVDVAKAKVLASATAHLGLDTARTVQEAVLDRAPDLTCPQLRNAVRRAELTLDPAAAAVRHERARAERSVTLTPASDSMAWLTAYLPADAAMTVMTGIDLLARLQERGYDGAADGTTSLGAGACGAGVHGAGTYGADGRGIDARRADALVDVFARILDTGHGPDGPIDTSALTAGARRRYRHPHLDVTASATTLLGLDDAPAVLAGYGPVPAAMARRIAARSTWEPLLVDARTGTMVARAGRCYRPSPALAGDVVRRDETCTFPGCRTAAWQADLDHIEPFDPERPAADQTRHTNLQALCRFHHRLKTHGSWWVERDDVTGATVWHSPTGHTYTRDPAIADPNVVTGATRASGGAGRAGPGESTAPGESTPSGEDTPSGGDPPGPPPF